MIQEKSKDVKRNLIPKQIVPILCLDDIETASYHSPQLVDSLFRPGNTKNQRDIVGWKHIHISLRYHEGPFQPHLP
jgi:hypothetical protein